MIQGLKFPAEALNMQSQDLFLHVVVIVVVADHSDVFDHFGRENADKSKHKVMPYHYGLQFPVWVTMPYLCCQSVPYLILHQK